MKALFSLVLLLCSFVYTAAQDKIYMTSGKIIECKVVEVGTEEIKYKLNTEADASLYAVKKLDVFKIEFSDGHVELIQEDLSNPELYKNDRKNAWKIDFLSPLFGSSVISHERSIRPGFSLEGGIGIIGLGINRDNLRPAGAFLRFGPRFFHAPDHQRFSTRYYHILKGAYIQPQFQVGAFGSDAFYTINGIVGPSRFKTRSTTSYGSLMIAAGRQVVFSNVFLLDIYSAIGWGYTMTTTNNIPSNAYDVEADPAVTSFGVTLGEDDIPFAFTFGIRVGFLPKPKK